MGELWPCEQGYPICGVRESSGRHPRKSTAAAPGGGRWTSTAWQASSGHSRSTMASRPQLDLHGVERARVGRQACSGRSRSSKASSGRGRRVGRVREGKLLAMGRKAHGIRHARWKLRLLCPSEREKAGGRSRAEQSDGEEQRVKEEQSKESRAERR